MDYIVAWSGSSARNGTADIKSLSGYLGRSSLFVPETRAPKDTAPARLHEDERRRESVKKYIQRRAVSVREELQIDSPAKRQREQNRQRSERNNQRRRTEQQDLFGTA